MNHDDTKVTKTNPILGESVATATTSSANVFARPTALRVLRSSWLITGIWAPSGASLPCLFIPISVVLRRLLGQLEFLLGDPPPSTAATTRGPVFPVPVQFVRNPRARRYLLRLGRDRIARVTIPRGGSEAFARRFVTDQIPWLQSQLDRLAALPERHGAWGPNTLVWWRGERLPLKITEGSIQLGDAFLGPWPSAGGEKADARPTVEAALRGLAERELPPLVLAEASRLGLVIQRVSVRNQRTRWGSCSRRGTVSLNWRLVQTPILVRDYLIAHELAHVREMNHSRRFWRVVEEFFPAWREAEAWLRRHGRSVID